MSVNRNYKLISTLADFHFDTAKFFIPFAKNVSKAMNIIIFSVS